MSVRVFLCRLFGGRDMGVSYDSSAQTISILGQPLSLSSLPAALQDQWAAAIGSASSTMTASRPAFGGDNIGVAVGNILDNQPTWRTAVTAALATFINEQTLGGQASDVAQFNR